MMMGVAIIIITHPITVILHELGHAIPAILFTKKKVTIYIGSYGETTKSLTFRVGLLEIWVKKTLFWKTGMCVPSSTTMSLSKKVLFVLCGPLASLTFTVIISYYVFKYDMHGSLKMILSFFMLAAIYDFISNIIPNKNPIRLPDGKVGYNDGNLLQKLFYLRKYPKEYETAVELFNQKEFDKCSIIFSNFLSRGFENEEIYRLAYSSYILNKEYEQAYQLLTHFEIKYELNSDDYYNFGFVCIRLKLNEEKSLYFEKSLALNPDNPYSLNAIGYYLTTENKYNEALLYLEKAIVIDKGFAYAYNNRGHAKIEIGDLEDGLVDIKHSLELDKENSYTYRNLGIYHLKLKQFKEANRLFLRAKEMDKETELVDELISQTNVQG
jgi:tetratricopeptide (TPR) repeat protein